MSIGSSNYPGAILALVVGYETDCTQPEIRILELDDEDFAGVSTNHNEPITGAKIRIDKGIIRNYDDQDGVGGKGTYTYSDGIFMFISRHTIASDGFFADFIAGETFYYTDDSLESTYHFSLNGSAAAYDWFIQECNKYMGVNNKNEESDIWGETTKVKRPGYDGPEWES